MKTRPQRTLLAVAIACLTWWSLAAAGNGHTEKVRVTAAWARATAPGVDAAAVYLTIHGGDRADRLMAVSTPRATVAQIHIVTTDSGVIRMRETEGIEIAAHATVLLAPEGRHVMLMGLSRPLIPGERFTLSLRFAQAGQLDVSVEVVPATGGAPAPH